MESIWVGMSGGVDSSVAALLLKRQGYAVTGVTLRLREGADCDIEDARRVCEKLAIPHRVLDLTERFRCCVMEEFVREYLAGRTPNPCVTCNRTIKFGALLDTALAEGAAAVATGHYARTVYDAASGRWQLFCAESAKDQSYVLYSLSQQQLAHVRFPLYGLEKSDVRALAQEYALPVADKGDSMEICFVPENDHAGFIERYTGRAMTPGEVVDEDGRVLGRHNGLGRYTIGQRRGLGLALGEPMYVIRLDIASNRVILGREGRQMRTVLTASHVNYVSIAPPASPIEVQAKIRYQAAPAAATLYPLEDGCVQLVFQAPQRSITPGQAVVFYDGRRLLGGATIENGQ